MYELLQRKQPAEQSSPVIKKPAPVIPSPLQMKKSPYAPQLNQTGLFKPSASLRASLNQRPGPLLPAPIQRMAEESKAQKPRFSMSNNTGIPTQMKREFEEKSGLSFDDVRVHYNSDKPAQLQALAYTQGNQVYVGRGQEKHLRHELGHVVQQKQGRVKPTNKFCELFINNSLTMEKEADDIGYHNILQYKPFYHNKNINFCNSQKVVVSAKLNNVIQCLNNTELEEVYNFYCKKGSQNKWPKLEFKDFNEHLNNYIRENINNCTREQIKSTISNMSKSDVLNCVINQLKIAPSIITFADQNLQDAENAIKSCEEINPNVIATHLVVDNTEKVDQRRLELKQYKKFNELDNVKICENGILEQNNTSLDLNGYCGTGMIIASHLYTSGYPNTEKTQNEVQSLQKNFFQMAENLDAPLVQNTFRAFDKTGKAPSRSHMNVYTNENDELTNQFYPCDLRRPNSDICHSKTKNNLRSHIIPHKHSLKITYGQFNRLFLFLRLSANDYLQKCSPHNKLNFKLQIDKALKSKALPPLLKLLLKENYDSNNLKQCALYILSFDSKLELTTRDILKQPFSFSPIIPNDDGILKFFK